VAEVRATEAVFHALAHASRRQILVVLHARGDRMSAGEIARRFACSWPTTSRHLKVLQDAGLVRVEKEGRERFYRLDRERLRATAGGWIEQLAGRRRP
jgi:DNA-binding transcriptional ArsR family regulator